MDLCKIRMAYRATFAWILFVLVWISCNFMTTSAGQTELDTFACEWPIRHARIVYERSELFNLGGSLEDTAPPNPDIPDDLRLRPRKQGKRGGIRVRLRRRRFNPPLPTIITGNAQSLCNKLEELAANVK